MEPPFEFCCRLSEAEDVFIFAARRASPALLHPEAQEGRFQQGLWQYDTAEFFIAPAGGEPYFEFNLAPNGAWWAAVFTSPRVMNPNAPTVPPGIVATGRATAGGWECEARIPLPLLRQLGINPAPATKANAAPTAAPAPCRLAVDAILNSPTQQFLTTAADLTGRPNFHRPWSWETLACSPEV